VAARGAGIKRLPLYALRHTSLSRLDPNTLACLAGYSDFAPTRRYVRPRAIRARQAVRRLISLS